MIAGPSLAGCQMRSQPAETAMTPDEAEAHSRCADLLTADIAYAGGGTAPYEACKKRELRQLSLDRAAGLR
jgi:hypothetical protein